MLHSTEKAVLLVPITNNIIMNGFGDLIEKEEKQVENIHFCRLSILFLKPKYLLELKYENN